MKAPSHCAEKKIEVFDKIFEMFFLDPLLLDGVDYILLRRRCCYDLCIKNLKKECVDELREATNFSETFTETNIT